MSRISQLSQCLVEKYGLSEQESEAFVTNLFDIIRESLLTDKIVKVKGLGTFKLAEMNARESVNVNTGERITIEGRYKLSFTPENAVRDRINSPFASFESMDMDNDVDFSDIDKKYESPEALAATPVEVVEEASPIASPEVAPSVEVSEVASPIASAEIASPLGEGESHSPAESEPEPTEEPITPVVDFVVDEPAEEPTVEEPASEPVAEEPTPVAEEPAPLVDVASPAVAAEVVSPSEAEPSAEKPVAEEPTTEKENPSPEPAPTPIVSASDQDKAVVRAPICEELIKTNMNHNQTIINLLHWLIALVVLVLLCIGGYFIYNVGRDNGAMEYYIHHNDVEDQDARAAESGANYAPTDKQKDEAKPKHDISLIKTPGAKPAAEEPEAKPEPKPAPAKPAAPAAKPATKSATTVASPSGKGESNSPSQPKPAATKPATTKTTATSGVGDAYNNKDARVRTGAYNIVGTQETITVKAGQTLKSISKFYLGEGMECYIEVYNGGKTTFNAGDKVKIPKLELKKKKK